MVSAKTKRWALIGALAVPTAIFALMWRAAGHRPRLFIGIGAPATAITLSRDGSQIVCSSQNGYLQKWMPERERFNSFPLDWSPNSGYSTSIPPPIELRLSPDADQLVAANFGSGLQLVFSWTMSDRKQKWFVMPQVPPYKIYRCAVSPDARLLAGMGHKIITVLDLTRPHPAPKSEQLFGLGANGVFGLPFENRLSVRFPSRATLPEAINVAAFSPDSRFLAFVTTAGTLKEWDMATKTSMPLPAPPLNDIATLSFSPDGRFLAASSASDSSDVAVLDLAAKTWTENMHAATPATAPTFAGSGFYNVQPFAPAWMPDSKSLWTGGDKVRRWSVPQLKQIRELPVDGPVAVSGDGLLVATRSVPKPGQPNGIWLWSLS